MSKPTFSEWLSNDLKKLFIRIIKFLTFNEKSSLAGGPEYMGGLLIWTILFAVILILGLSIIHSRFWLRLWGRTVIVFCLVCPIMFALKAKYRYEAKKNV